MMLINNDNINCYASFIENYNAGTNKLINVSLSGPSFENQNYNYFDISNISVSYPKSSPGSASIGSG